MHLSVTWVCAPFSDRVSPECRCNPDSQTRYWTFYDAISIGGAVGKERPDEFLEEIDEELKSLHVKVKKIVSEANTVLQECQGDQLEEEAEGTVEGKGQD